MFNPPDNLPVLKLYREPVKPETEEQQVIRELREQLIQRDEAILKLELKNEKLQYELKEAIKQLRNDSNQQGLSISKGVQMDPPKIDEKLNVEYPYGKVTSGGKSGDRVAITLGPDDNKRHLMYKENPCKEIAGLLNEDIFYDSINNQLIYKNRDTGNVVRVVPVRATKDCFNFSKA